MAAVLNIVIEEKHGRIETLMTGGGKGQVTQGEVSQVMGLSEVIREALAASGGELYARFDVKKATKAAGIKTH
ncbi:hypothetical protein H6W05_003561 [Salmonella enterica]|nr:hypothetical protein [Salmonella enterica]EKB5039439.1 hypothetical protein [Salmonella enterica]EME1065115.1 hypothetical protein [Salmonella enterica]